MTNIANDVKLIMNHPLMLEFLSSQNQSFSKELRKYLSDFVLGETVESFIKVFNMICKKLSLDTGQLSTMHVLGIFHHLNHHIPTKVATRGFQALPYEDGWGDLFEGLQQNDLDSVSLEPASNISMAPCIAAYKRAGFPKDSILLSTLDDLIKTSGARVVSQLEFKNAIKYISRILVATIHSYKGCTVFGLNASVKSNLWVFLLIMTNIKQMCTDKRWTLIRKKVWIMMPNRAGYQNTNNMPMPTPSRLVIADDCAYSGDQLTKLMDKIIKLSPVAFTSISVCTPYATISAIDNLTTRHDVSLVVPHTIGYTHTSSEELLENNLMVCVKGVGNADSEWIGFSLYEVMGLARHKMSNDPITISSKLIGGASVVFAHKLADEISIPNRWFTLGPTIRFMIEKLCPSVLCRVRGKQEVMISFLPMTDFIKTVERGVVHFEVKNSVNVAHFSDLKEQGTLVDVSKLPLYLPLLQPFDACGVKFGAHVANLNKGVYSEYHEKTTCELAKYKHKLTTRLKQLLVVGKSSVLCSVLNIR